MSFSVATGVSAASSGNGVGKTNAMRAVMGILRTGPGEVCWHGRTVDDEVRRRFGYMPEERGLYKAMRMREHLVFLARLHGQRRNEAERSADRWIEALGLAERQRSVVEDLSFGNQQRRSSLPHWPTPPTSSCLTNLLGSRPHRCRRHERRVAREQAAAGTAVVFSSHQLDLVEHLRHEVVVVHRGQVVLSGCGRPAQAPRSSAPEGWRRG